MPVHRGTDQREFFVWVDPSNPGVQHNMSLVGSFSGGPADLLGGGSPEYLPFVHNPDVKPGIISPFHNNTISHYRVEYNLEVERHAHPEFTRYPSRLWALFLLETRGDAAIYQAAHPDHTKNRVMKRCVTKGPYTFSKHDAAWIDFLRLGHMIDNDTWSHCFNGYWSGARADQVKFISQGKSWTSQMTPEVLFYGRVDFPNKNPAVPD